MEIREFLVEHLQCGESLDDLINEISVAANEIKDELSNQLQESDTQNIINTLNNYLAEYYPNLVLPQTCTSSDLIRYFNDASGKGIKLFKIS